MMALPVASASCDVVTTGYGLRNVPELEPVIREIGRVLHISEHTAANHIRSILRKTRCANRTEAAAYALRRGLVPADTP